MKNLLIVGARGFGREIYNLAKQCCGYKTEFLIKGFLDDKFDALRGLANYPPIINSVEEYIIEENDIFVVALGDVNFKKKYIDKIKQKNGKFHSLIHPTAIINSNTIIGEGVLIGQFTIISCDCFVGNYVTMHSFCNLGHDIKIGDFSSLGPYTFLGGFAQIENLVTIHPRVSVMPHKVVRKSAVVGAGSVVMRNVPENVTVHGNPAKIIFSDNLIK